MPRPASPPLITAAEFRTIGHQLYGDTWQTTLARALDLQDRNVRYMAAGERTISSPTLVAAIAALCRARAAELEETADRLDRVAAEAHEEAASPPARAPRPRP